MLRSTLRCFKGQVMPPSVLVLSMTLNGGALGPALRELGYHTYTFETTFRHGHVLTHPPEWLAVLQHLKPFDPIILTRPAQTSTDTHEANGEVPHTPQEVAAAAASPTAPDASETWMQFDALVGPPATLAFESILRTCPLSTRVILVEEPDKEQWERHMDLILQQVRRQTRTLGMAASAQRLADMVDAMTDIRRALGQRRERTMRQQKVLSGRPLHNLSQGAALSLFEDHVKDVVPRDRLLIYRLGDGWEPLCTFLSKQIPLDTTTTSTSTPPATSTTPRAVSDAVSTARPLPFPVNTDGLEVLSTLTSATQNSQMVMLLVSLGVVGFAIFFLAPFVFRLKALYAEEAAQYRASVEPYLEEGERTGSVSLRRMLILSKKAALNHQASYQEDGGFGQQWRKAWSQLLGGDGGSSGETCDKSNQPETLPR